MYGFYGNSRKSGYILGYVKEERKKMEDIAPYEGKIVMLSLTLNQYKGMYVIRGEGIPLDEYLSLVIFLNEGKKVT